MVNKKREKILQIHGYKEKDDQMQQQEDENEEKTLFVNLNRIFKDQSQKEEARQDLILDDPTLTQAANTNNYLTENP